MSNHEQQNRAGEPATGKKEEGANRGWFSKHGGTFVILLTFGALIAVVIIKNLCR